MPPLASSPDASFAEASSRSLQIQRTPAEQDRRRKDRLAKRQKKLEAKQRDRNQSISGQRKGEQPTSAPHRQESQRASENHAAPARTVEPQTEDRTLSRKRARSQSRIRDRSPSPYRAAAKARSKSRGRGNVSEEISYSRADSDDSSSDDSDGSGGEIRLVQGPSKRTKLEDNLERTALLTFRLRPSSSQFERVLDGVPSLATAQEHVRTKFHLGNSSVFRLSSESPLGGSVVLEDEEDFRAFKLRVLRSRAESTVITVDVTPAELVPPSARMSASTSPSPAPGAMLPPYLKHLAVQGPPRAPPMASTPTQAPAAKPRPSDTRPMDRAAMSLPLQALPPPVLPVKRPAPPPLPAAESGPYVPPSLRAKYTAASASTSSGSPNVAPALSPNLETLAAPTAPVPLDPKATAYATLTMTKPQDVSKAEARKLRKGPSASQKWVEGRILAKTPCGICKALPFHACYDCPELMRGGLPYAEERLEALKQMKKKRAWHNSAIKDLEAVIANTKASPPPNNPVSGSGAADKTSIAGVEETAPVQAAAPATLAADAGKSSPLPVPSALSSVPAPAAASSSSSPVLASTGLQANAAAPTEGHEARAVDQPTAQPVQQAVEEEQDELAATQEMEQRQSQLPGPAGAHVTSAAPATEEAAQTAIPSAPKTSDAVPNADAPDRDDAVPIDTDARGPSQSQQLTERQAQRQLKQRETKWNKIRKDCAAAQDKVRQYIARETRGENMPGPARYHFARHRTTLKQKTAELEELDSEFSDFATRMNLPRPPRAPELDVKIPEAEVRRSPRVAGVQKSPVPAPSGDAASSAAQRGEGNASGTQTRSQESNVPPAIPAKKQVGRPKKLAVSSDTQGEDPPANTKGRKSLTDIEQTIDTSATQSATPAVGSVKARVGLRTPLSDHSEDDVETSPILRSVASEQATEKIDEQPLPPPMMQATASPRITRRTSQTKQPTVAENENDADDELESAAEGPRPTPRSPVKRGGEAGSPTSKAALHSAPANGDAGSERRDVPSQSSTAPPSSALTLPDPSQAPSRRITRQAAPRLASSSSSGSETSDDSDDSDEEMQGPEVAAEDDAEDDDEAESGAEEEEASVEDDTGGADPGGSGEEEEEEEDEIEATQVAKGAVNGSGTKPHDRSVSPASSHTRSRSNSAASSIDSAGSKGGKDADEQEEDVASSSSTAMLSDREEEADPISTFSKQPASPVHAPREAVQAPRSSGIFSSFNFFQSNRNSQDVNGTKAATTQPNGISSRSANGANHSASQPTQGRRPKLSMPRLSELDASVLLRRRQQPNESAASSQASTPIVATTGQNLAAPFAATDDDDEGPDEAEDNESGSEYSSSSSDSSSDSDDGKNKKKASPAQKKGKAGAAKNIMPASKRASVAVEAKKKRKGLADLF